MSIMMRASEGDPRHIEFMTDPKKSMSCNGSEVVTVGPNESGHGSNGHGGSKRVVVG